MRKVSFILLGVATLLVSCLPTQVARKEMKVGIRANEVLAETISGAEEAKPAEYRIGIEDILDISIWEVPELSKKVTVRPDGKLSFPLIGDIQAQGRTLKEVDDEITEKLTVYVREPQVSVIIDKFGGKKILVLGEIKTPGAYTFTGTINVMEIISRAGGYTEDAVLKSTKVIRGSLKEPMVISINAERLFFKGDLRQNIALLPGDIVYVPKRFIANVNYWIRQFTPALTNILSYEQVETFLTD